MTKAFLLFHLNLAYSSVPETARGEMIRRCYHPVLDLAEQTCSPVGIELTGWTLEQIRALDPAWIERCRALLDENRCELIGSGHAQLIGPLVPYDVNVWNQKLGREGYVRMLGHAPKLALVNEMAYSSGLVDVYEECGYVGMVMDRDNVRLALDLDTGDYEAVPSVALGAGDARLPVLWSDSILFQKLQRYAHGDIPLSDYLTYFRARAAAHKRPLAVYCNDAEIFDYRPGRFREEPKLHVEGEWTRVRRLLQRLTHEEGVVWESPSVALASSLEAVPGATPQNLTSIRQPIPVKKQAKYNVSRWAVTGRNDTRINTECHRLHRQIQRDFPEDANAWRKLCELWASDLRTHITADRWQHAQDAVAALRGRLRLRDERNPTPDRLSPIPAAASNDGVAFGQFSLNSSGEGIYLDVKSPKIKLTLNLRRGLAIHALAFKSHDFVPTVGTLPHGYFESIDLGADYYSGGVILELPGEHRRVTDLERVSPEIRYDSGVLQVGAVVATPYGDIEKRVVLYEQEERVSMQYAFPGWRRPHGSLRAGILTLLGDAFRNPVGLTVANGGKSLEKFFFDRPFDHTAPSSVLVSCSTGLGATTGELVLGDKRRKLGVSWDPSECALFPMLMHRVSGQRALIRVIFSVAELDDTSRPEGDLPSFGIHVSSKQP